MHFKRIVYCIVLLVGLNCIPAISETQVLYSKVEMDLRSISAEKLTLLGSAMDHQTSDDSIFEGIVSQYDLELFNKNQITYKILIHNMSEWYVSRNLRNAEVEAPSSRGLPTPENFKYGSMGGYLTFAEIVEELDNMKELYPELISDKWEFGRSLEDRPLWAVRISNNPDQEEPDRPKVAYDALIHAREPMSMMNLMYFMWHLLENYSKDEEIKQCIDHMEIYVIPCLNPDGYEYNRRTFPDGGGLWRKNRSQNEGGSRGVDLNRNFSVFWGNDIGSSGDGTLDTYRGPRAFSEPETQAYRDLYMELRPSHSINHHSYTNALITPYGMGGWPSNRTEYERIAEELTKETGWKYGPTPIILGYSSSGTVRDWSNDEVGAFTFVSELGSSDDGFWPPKSRIEPLAALVLDQNMSLMRDACPPPTGTIESPGIRMNGFEASISSNNEELKVEYKHFNLSKKLVLSLRNLQGSQLRHVELSGSEGSLSILHRDFAHSIYLLEIGACVANGCHSTYRQKIVLGK